MLKSKFRLKVRVYDEEIYEGILNPPDNFPTNTHYTVLDVGWTEDGDAYFLLVDISGRFQTIPATLCKMA